MNKAELTMHADFLRKVKIMLEGLNETAQEMADHDTRRYIADQVDMIHNAIDSHITQHFIPVTPLSSKEVEYIRQQQHLMEEEHLARRGKRGDLDNSEQRQLWEARFFLQLRDRIKEDDRIAEMREQDIMNYIDNELVPLTGMKDYFHSTEFLHAGFRVLAAVKDWIMEERRKAPQTALPFS